MDDFCQQCAAACQIHLVKWKVGTYVRFGRSLLLKLIEHGCLSWLLHGAKRIGNVYIVVGLVWSWKAGKSGRRLTHEMSRLLLHCGKSARHRGQLRRH